MFKDNKLRLLMTLAGMERLGEDEPDASWIIPSSLTFGDLQETYNIISKYRDNPVMHYGEEDPISAIDMLQRKSAVQQTSVFVNDSDEDAASSNGEEDFLFPPNARVARKSDALSELKKKRRKQRTQDSDDENEPLDEETLRARKKAREEAERARRRKIKSTEFITSSDDEDNEERDREFFANEERRRAAQVRAVEEALNKTKITKTTKKMANKKRKAAAESDASDLNMASDSENLDSSPVSKRLRHFTPADSDLDLDLDLEDGDINLPPRDSPSPSPASSEGENERSETEAEHEQMVTESSNTPLSSSPHPVNHSKEKATLASFSQPQSPVKEFKKLELEKDEDEEMVDGGKGGGDEDEDLPSTSSFVGRRRKGAVLVDDDDDDDSE